MKLIKLQLLILTLFLFTASPTFATISYHVSIDTSSLDNSSGYLYMQYNPGNDAPYSCALIEDFSTDGSPAGARSPGAFPNSGAMVFGMLPNTVAMVNFLGVNDYSHGITFGDYIDFNLSLAWNPSSDAASGGSTFSFSLFADASGNVPLLTGDGTLFLVDLDANGTATPAILASQASVAPVPVPAAAWLLVSGLAGLLGARRKMKSHVV